MLSAQISPVSPGIFDVLHAAGDTVELDTRIPVGTGKNGVKTENLPRARVMRVIDYFV
jgi:hypothetical protein